MAACSEPKTLTISGVLLLLALTIPVSGIEKEPLTEYASRRARVAAEIKGNALILFGNADNDLVKFKQEDNFYYLTGFSEPERCSSHRRNGRPARRDSVCRAQKSAPGTLDWSHDVRR